MSIETPTQRRVHAGQGTPPRPVEPTRQFVRALVVESPQVGVVRDDIPFMEPACAHTAEGEAAWANERGTRKANNQDAMVVDLLRQGFAVVDGMGGTHDGRLAASIMAEEIQGTVFRAGRKMSEAHATAHERICAEIYEKFGKRHDVTARRIAADPQLTRDLREEMDSGATYVAARVFGGVLHAWVAGDARLVVLRGGRPAWSSSHGRGGTPDGSHKRFREWPAQGVSGGLDPHEFRPLKMPLLRLEPGDRVVIASDGLWDNLADESKILPGCLDFEKFAVARAQAQNAQLARAVYGLSPARAVQALKRFQDAPFGDNMSAVVYDWKGPSAG